MKKIFVLFCFVFALTLASVQGQAANQVFANDTTKGAQTKYFTGTKEASIYQGIVGFTFTTSHDADSVFLEGCYTTNAWYSIDTVAVTGATSKNRELYQTPPKYKYYRLRRKGTAGDTCYYSNVRYFLKY